MIGGCCGEFAEVSAIIQSALNPLMAKIQALEDKVDKLTHESNSGQYVPEHDHKHHAYLASISSCIAHQYTRFGMASW